jgi:hypothetical protein
MQASSRPEMKKASQLTGFSLYRGPDCRTGVRRTGDFFLNQQTLGSYAAEVFYLKHSRKQASFNSK